MRDYITKALAATIRNSSHASIVDNAVREACALAYADGRKAGRRKYRWSSEEVQQKCDEYAAGLIAAVKSSERRRAARIVNAACGDNYASLNLAKPKIVAQILGRPRRKA